MKQSLIAACARILPVLLVVDMSSETPGSRVRTSTRISVDEAEILAYVSPPAHRVRLAGRDVWIEPMANVRQFNYSNCFYLYVSDPESEATGSILVGHYFVNKFTAGIWESGPGEGAELDDTEVRGVQTKIRKLHNISEEQIAKVTPKDCWIPQSPSLK